MPGWPDWWNWELDVSNPHLREQMIRRRFNETDLRDMLERATGLRLDHEPGRWIAESTFDDAAWEVILEPHEGLQVLIVVTAFEVY